nr:MAG TPA: hypothetical protein [Caudoviricetes sp.]
MRNAECFFRGLCQSPHLLLAISGGEMYNKHRKGVAVIHGQPLIVGKVFRLSW